MLGPTAGMTSVLRLPMQGLLARPGRQSQWVAVGRAGVLEPRLVAPAGARAIMLPMATAKPSSIGANRVL